MSESKDTNEAADGQSLLTGVLGVAARLRHKTCGEISCDQCNDEREAAADAIERLHAIVERAGRLEALYHNTNLNPEGFQLTIEWIARDAKAVLTPNVI